VAIKGASGPMTGFYLLAALRPDPERGWRDCRGSADQAIYRDVFARTFTISFAVTVLCLILGFPVAYLLATLPAGQSNLLMIFVLLPFLDFAIGPDLCLDRTVAARRAVVTAACSGWASSTSRCG